MCNKAMSCSMFRKSPNVHKEKKIEKKRKQSPKTAPWLRTPEPPVTERKREEKGKEKRTPWPQEKKRPQENLPQSLRPKNNPIPILSHAIRSPPKLQNQAKAPAALLKHSRSHPQHPRSPPPPPGGWGPRALAEGTWPSMAGHREARSPSSNGRYRG